MVEVAVPSLAALCPAIVGLYIPLAAILYRGLDRTTLLPFRGLLEIPDALSHRAADLRELSGAENNQHDHKKNNHFRHSDSEHGATS